MICKAQLCVTHISVTYISGSAMASGDEMPVLHYRYSTTAWIIIGCADDF